MRPSLCPLLLTVTTREPSLRIPSRSNIEGSSKPVSAKWPRWLVPSCCSKPSAVTCRGIAITPALLTSRSSCGTSACRLSAKARIDASEERSSGRTSTAASGTCSTTRARAVSPRAASRQPMMTRAPAWASSRVVTRPSPLLAPVTTATRPDWLGMSRALHFATTSPGSFANRADEGHAECQPHQSERDEAGGRPQRVHVVPEQVHHQQSDDAADERDPVLDQQRDELCARRAKKTQHLHAASSTVRVSLRNIRTAIADSPAVNASSTTIDASPPGQSTPSPSPAQNVPNEQSIPPTRNFSVFSGTRDSGWRTTMPTAATATNASAAPSDAAARA